jgi:phenylacetate-coenzyme A ligase PaaK-like adenylate-forming protein
MPLLRYRIGDRGIWLEDQRCACGRPFPLVHPTVTREGDCVLAPDGRILSPRAISPLVRRKSFRVCQFIQETTDSLTVRIVAGNGRTEKDAEDVRKALRAVVGDSIQLSVQWAERPIQHLNGKIPIVISNLGKRNEREVPHR